MKIETLVVGPLATNCYFLQSDDGREAILVDPGGDPDLLIDRIKATGIERMEIVITHGHGDHIDANAEISEYFHCPISIGHLDAKALTDPNVNLSIFIGSPIVSPAASKLLYDGDFIALGGEKLKVLETPGHSVGSICLYSETSGFVICGDLLFKS